MPLSSAVTATIASLVLRQRMIPSAPDRLQLTSADLRAAIKQAGPTAGLLRIIFGHAITAHALAYAGVRYLCQGDDVREAYRRMTTAEFARLNARQAWANWRTIPRNLHGHLPIHRPVVVVDLCCGKGDSTSALAWWLPAGSRIIGIELDQRFAKIASANIYRNRAGAVIPVTIHTGSVLEPFRDHHGDHCDDRSVDLVHAIGSIGCHFSQDQTAVIFRECDRVLRDDGFALLDTGKAGTSATQLTRLAHERGFVVVRRSRSWLFDRYEQLVVRRAA